MRSLCTAMKEAHSIATTSESLHETRKANRVIIIITIITFPYISPCCGGETFYLPNDSTFQCVLFKD